MAQFIYRPEGGDLGAGDDVGVCEGSSKTFLSGYYISGGSAFDGPKQVFKMRKLSIIIEINLCISEIIANRRTITADTDLRLCRFSGLSSGYSLRAQATHDTEVAERELAPILRKIKPWAHMRPNKVLQQTPQSGAAEFYRNESYQKVMHPVYIDK